MDGRQWTYASYPELCQLPRITTSPMTGKEVGSGPNPVTLNSSVCGGTVVDPWVAEKTVNGAKRVMLNSNEDALSTHERERG